MKHIKIILLFVIAMSICQPLMSENVLPTWLSLNDLTTPSSPSYVPYPFPETSEEIVADLKFYLKRSYANQDQSHSNSSKEVDLLYQLIMKNSTVKIEGVVKVTNRIPGYPSGYSYLIIIKDLESHMIARVSMRACGLVIGGTTPSLEKPGIELKNNADVIARLSKYNKAAYLSKNIKGVERVAFDITFAPPHRPIYEITMKDGAVYYVDYYNRIYRKTYEKKVEGDAISFFKGELRQLRSDQPKVMQKERCFLDSIQSKIVYMVKIADKEQN